MNIHVTSELGRFAELRRRILELHPDLDEQTLADTLEGATNLREVLTAAIRSALNDEDLATALRERIETMTQRLRRFETRAYAMRQLVAQAMQTAELKKIMEPDFTASLRMTPPGVEIVAEGLIPESFRIPQPSKIDRRGILSALNCGQEVPGAALTQPKTSLMVRSA